MEWTDAGVEGAWRFVNRSGGWSPSDEIAPPAGTPLPAALAEGTAPAAPLAVFKEIHRALANVGDDLERFHFNKAVARIHELANALASLKADGDGDHGPAGCAARRHRDARPPDRDR